MEPSFLFFLSSGLFLGWSLGANDAVNIFGTAVGSKMVRFSTIAIIASVFVVLGAVLGGTGTSETLGELGEVNALAGAFMVALSAALSVYCMLRAGITVSTSQAIVGAIIGWNLYAGKHTDYETLTKIVLSWAICPVISGVVAALLYVLCKKYLRYSKLHLLMRDQLTRIGLILTAAIGAYALGSNNIANVVGVFVKSSPFKPLSFGNVLTLNAEQVLFLMGALAICVGIMTYAKKVIIKLQNGLMNMAPLEALLVVLAQAIVLLLFSSVMLYEWLCSHNLPTLPLVPISSTQAVIGAIIGIGLVKGGRNLNWSIILRMVTGWIVAPVMAMLICFISLFFLANVFNLTVYLPNSKL